MDAASAVCRAASAWAAVVGLAAAEVGTVAVDAVVVEDLVLAG